MITGIDSSDPIQNNVLHFENYPDPLKLQYPLLSLFHNLHDEWSELNLLLTESKQEDTNMTKNKESKKEEQNKNTSFISLGENAKEQREHKKAKKFGMH